MYDRVQRFIAATAAALFAAYVVFLIVDVLLYLDTLNNGAWRNAPLVGPFLGMFDEPGSHTLDIMIHTSGLAFFFALWLSAGVNTRMEVVIETMTRYQSLNGTPQQLNELRDKRLERSTNLARRGAIAIAIAEFFVIFFAMAVIPWLICGEPLIEQFTANFFALIIVAPAAGALAGYFLGQMSGFGAFYQIAKDANCEILPRMDSPDGYAGLGELSAFLSRQGWLSLIPVLWIAGWLILLSFPLETLMYAMWRLPFLALLILAIIYGYSGFYRPRRDVEAAVEAGLQRATQDGTREGRLGLSRVKRRMLPRAFFYPVIVVVFLVLIVFLPVLTGLAKPSGILTYWAACRG